MKDFLGQELSVGDKVVTLTAYRSGRLWLSNGIVSRLTPMKVEVEIKDGPFSDRAFLKDPSSVLVVARPECIETCTRVGYCNLCNRNSYYQDRYEPNGE